ncbi:MAG: biotin--[acetyl-CoA-carboxylase] ligase, partial [Rubrivivax sp.]|nr:biotin--[acetyl-CoA-carboxylase] ligase [Rubrivivax sp.]
MPLRQPALPPHHAGQEALTHESRPAARRGSHRSARHEGTAVSTHLHWGAEALWQGLEPLLPGLSVEVLARAESTNTVLLERARAMNGRRDAPITRPGELNALHVDERTPHGRRSADVQACLLVAEHQTRGRGRLGRDWTASAGASLTFSLALPLAPHEWSGLSLAVGLALAEALDPVAEAGLPPRIGLKWPNDLWLIDGPGHGRKLGGILIETVSVGQHRMCVVGVGLNVLPQAHEGLTHGYA